MKKIVDKYSHMEPRSKRYYYRHKEAMHKKRLEWGKSAQYDYDTKYYADGNLVDKKRVPMID